MKKRVEPLTPQQTRVYLLNPEKFDINKLDANEMLQGNNAMPLAKIPQIKDRIRIDDTGRISLVIGKKTNAETGETEEETVEIGGRLGNVMPGMMVISDEYHNYFDVYGNLVVDPMRENTSSGAAAPPAWTAVRNRTRTAAGDSTHNGPSSATGGGPICAARAPHATSFTENEHTGSFSGRSEPPPGEGRDTTSGDSSSEDTSSGLRPPAWATARSSTENEHTGSFSGRSEPPRGEGKESSNEDSDWVEKIRAAGIEHTPMFNSEIRNTHRELKGEKLKKRIEEELKKNNYVQIGDLEFVRYPNVAKEKIRVLPQNEKGLYPVEYIHDRWYDPKRKQMRNRKTRIGYIIDVLPGIMIPNRRYDSCFEASSGKAFEDSFTEMMEGIRKYNEERQQREEEQRRRREEDESYRELFGEDNEHSADVARMHLEEMLSEMREQRAEANADNEEDYEEYEDVEEADNESVGELNPTQASTEPGTRMTHQEEETEMSQRPSHFAGVSMEDERAAVLEQILKKITESIKNQAKKHPDALVNVFKARKINEILIEIKIRYRDSGYEDLLELIEEPHEVEEDGQRYLTGMTYSDVEVLLCHYSTILHHIHLKRKK